MRESVLQTGSIFHERYEIVATIADGDLSAVYRALDVHGGHEVALKIVNDDALHDNVSHSALRKRFLREAKLASMLESAGSVHIYDFGESGDQLYMVMEFVDGPTLADEIAEGRVLNPEWIEEVISQVLEVLAEAHSHGILHRDIKPANIMITDAPHGGFQAKLLDFGVAKVYMDDEAEDLTRAGMLVGTLRYMAPEQFRSNPLTLAVDVYSLGVVIYELVTGTHPVPDTNLLETIREVSDPTPLSLPVDAPVTATFRAIVDKMLRKDPARRYQSAGEALSELISQDSVLERAAGASSGDKLARADGGSERKTREVPTRGSAGEASGRVAPIVPSRRVLSTDELRIRGQAVFRPPEDE